MRWRATADLTDGFFVKLSVMCDQELHCSTINMLGVMNAESGVRADARNVASGAVGPIQMLPSTLKGLGYTGSPGDFVKLSAEEQLPWVRRYFADKAGKLGSAAAIYTAVFLPALLDRATDSRNVLVEKGGQLGWAYAMNAVFDANRDYKITVGELEDAIRRNQIGPRWEEIHRRAFGLPPAPIDTTRIDLQTTLGWQRALNIAGFSAGSEDGIPGPMTRAALVSFQAFSKLAPDGIPGPLTRAAMQKLLASMGASA